MAVRSEPKHLLISDLDDTLLGDDEALERFRAFHDTHRALLGVVYASGRFCNVIQDLVEHTRLPVPLATIGGVGSEIWTYPGRRPMQEWWDEIGDGWSDAAVRRALAGVPGLEDQPDTEQSPYKVSYYWRDASPDDLAGLEERLARAGAAGRLIYSSGRDLDVLPPGVDKGAAAAWLAAYLGYAPEDVLAAGNSLNDEALLSRGFDGIVVGNAHDELKRLGGRERVYVAGKGWADGVIEGINHWLEVM